MKIKDALQRDPASYPLVNQGQARIPDSGDERTQAELRGELETFVCEGQYADGIQKIVRSFLDNSSRTSQRGAWVSGFFGSGKSHLLKMLCHLWQDTSFPDGSTARNLVPSMPDDLRALLRELDTAGKRSGGLIAAAGALLSGTSDNVRLTILSILLRAVGLPEQYPQARFCLWLHSQGQFDKVKAAVEGSGKAFERELNNLYVSGPVARAVMASDANFAASEAEARQLLKAQFPPQATDITTEQFLLVAKEALKLRAKDGRLPCTLLILDEAQQYIGDSQQRASLLTEVTEAVSKQLDGHIMVVAAGQSALTEIQLLTYLLDRFTIRVPLSDAEVETVTRKVLLQKKPTAVADVRALLDKHAGEVSRQLQGTRIGETIEDRAIIVDDYPLLPVRRRFWEHCFRQIDAAGTSSQLRSQLRIIHDAVANVSDRPLGSVVPADELFEALAPEMVNTGVLLREINERIILVGRTEGPIAQRICGLVFLIGKLKREAGADIGVRATKDHIADLLIDDLAADNGKLRSDVEDKLKKLSDQGMLMLVSDEYRLQTREGSDWDREFRNRQTKLNNDDAAIQFKRDQLLYGDIDKAVRAIRVMQGAAKEPRQFLIHREQIAPVVDGSSVPIWIRDGWSCAEKDVLEAARSAGTDSPILFVFIPRQSAEDVRRLIVETDAAQQTLDAKGNPTTAEGQEARQSMDSRRARAMGDRDKLIRDVVANAKVFQGGGSEVLLTSLDERVKTATEASLVRMFPRFKDADSAAWEAVIKRAREGADHPFQPTGHTDATEKHAVCQQVIATIGAGMTGSDVRKTLGGSPFGWPRDAVDAALIALHRLQHITATLNGQAVSLGQLDQNKIAKAEFRVEHATLSVSDRLILRKLFQALGLSCKSGEEAARAGEFLTSLIALAKAAGGEAPLPAGPAVTEIEDVQRLIGNEQLVAIKNRAIEWEDKLKAWGRTRDLIATRLPAWGIVGRLARHAAEIPEAKPQLDQIDAIRSQCLLLEAADPANTVRQVIAAHLRDAVQKGHAAHEAAFTAANATLAANGMWVKLKPSDQDSIKSAVGLFTPSKPDVATDEALADALDRKPLAGTQAEVDAIAGRINQAIERAARLLEPKVQTVTLERSTLRNPAEVEAWIDRQKMMLLSRVADGPVLVS
ncbi:BREX system P-loop protein BrxC [Bradyrhizobium sp. 183]|uniref:BREX system P-loop protein BrxC n=1 Tax=unclassified Bradyrhizobium TaxID=2631580 RepID=UPI001FFFE93B|nr:MULTISPECIES: BREX system P-loop protein BrxC [unclassified Bradyrhizobium]UPJ79826.1 BREX system P-loop protein BrxC [Bradyrhizobium sp. 184]UPJ87621.1 BREX system P-loop protein BrxC [Bradyrhizobium sp. 183]